MNGEEAKKYLRTLGEALQQRQITGEILVNDGMIVMLDIGKPGEQVDIDAYALMVQYVPKEEITVDVLRGIRRCFKQ